jgi:hypothetical protein
MQIKKLLAATVFVLGAWMSVGAMAQSVTYLGNDIYTYNVGSTNMNFNVTISNTSGFDSQLTSMPWWRNESLAQSFSAAAVDNAQGANFAYSSFTQSVMDPNLMVNRYHFYRHFLA